jgi:hypothetical protein
MRRNASKGKHSSTQWRACDVRHAGVQHPLSTTMHAWQLSGGGNKVDVSVEAGVTAVHAAFHQAPRNMVIPGSFANGDWLPSCFIDVLLYLCAAT